MPGSNEKVKRRIGAAAILLFLSTIACSFSGKADFNVGAADGTPTRTPSALPSNTLEATPGASATAAPNNGAEGVLPTAEPATSAEIADALAWLDENYIVDPNAPVEEEVDVPSMISAFAKYLMVRNPDGSLAGVNASPSNVIEYVRHSRNADAAGATVELPPQIEPFTNILFDQRTAEKPGLTIESRAQGQNEQLFYDLGQANNDPEAFFADPNHNPNVFEADNGVILAFQVNPDGTQQLNVQTYMENFADVKPLGESNEAIVSEVLVGIDPERAKKIAKIWQDIQIAEISNESHQLSDNPYDVRLDTICAVQRAAVGAVNDLVLQGQDVKVLADNEDITGAGMDLSSFDDLVKLARGKMVNGLTQGFGSASLDYTGFGQAILEAGGINAMTDRQLAELFSAKTKYMVNGFTAFTTVPGDYENQYDLDENGVARAVEMFMSITCGNGVIEITATLPPVPPSATPTRIVITTPTVTPTSVETPPTQVTGTPPWTSTPSETNTPPWTSTPPLTATPTWTQTQSQTPPGHISTNSAPPTFTAVATGTAAASPTGEFTQAVEETPEIPPPTWTLGAPPTAEPDTSGASEVDKWFVKSYNDTYINYYVSNED